MDTGKFVEKVRQINGEWPKKVWLAERVGMMASGSSGDIFHTADAEPHEEASFRTTRVIEGVNMERLGGGLIEFTAGGFSVQMNTKTGKANINDSPAQSIETPHTGR